jgi:26S proteasome non-ATPase regulatory subunit 9
MFAFPRAGEGFPRPDVDVMLVRQTRQKIICLQNDHKAKMKELDAALQHLHTLKPVMSASSASSAGSSARQANGSAASASSASASSSASPSAAASSTTASLRPFILVDEVQSNSPAHEAGLCVGDRVVRFGSLSGVSSSSSSSGVSSSSGSSSGGSGSSGSIAASPSLNDVAAEVRRNENVAIEVTVLRSAREAAATGDASGSSGPDVVRVTLSLVPHKWPGQGLLGCHIVPV